MTMSRKMKSDETFSMHVLKIIDILIATLVVGPLIISFWRGIWEYMNYNPKSFPFGWTLYISLAVHLSFILIQDAMLEASRNSFFCHMLSRFYIYVVGVLIVIEWRSLWVMLDAYIGNSFYVLTASTSVCILILCLLRGICNLTAAPYYISLDHKIQDIYPYSTMFKKKSTDDLWLYMLDCGFSVCVVGTLVVFVWRGVWCLIDMYLYPGDLATSAWTSLAIGYSLVLISFATQPLIKMVVTRVSGLFRLCAVDLYLLFSFCGTINVWRGVWNLLNVYFFPDRPALSYWMSHFLAFLLLVLINSSNSVLVRGVYIDAEEEGEQCVDFPCYYLRLFFQEKRKRRLIQQLQKKQVETLARRKSEADGLIKEGNTDGQKAGRRQSLQVILNCQEVV